MAKKKSKTQKYKKNLRKKQNKAAKISIEKSNIIKVEQKTKEKILEALNDEIITEEELPILKDAKKIIAEKEEINYNIILSYENKEKLKSEIKKEIKEDIKNEIIDGPKKITEEESLDDYTSPFMTIIKDKNNKKPKPYIEVVSKRIKNSIKTTLENIKRRRIEKAKIALKNKNNIKKAPKTVKQVNKETYNPYEIKKEIQPPKSKNIIIRALYTIYKNSHIIFNSIGIIIFIILIVGLIRIKVYQASTIIYISSIIGFLLFIAIAFNKYLSGKILTLILSTGMFFAIYHMQYTYDFIRNLNASLYEYKTYYVVTFDNGVNKSIYNINNKKVGLLKDNCINIERKLDTKIEPVYLEYEDINELYNDFYNNNYRAIIVNENQYKYLKNNIQNNKSVKILYEFEANAKK